MRKAFFATAPAAASMVALAPQSQAAQSGVRVGTLTCHVRGGWGHLVASSRQMNCMYEPYHHRAERYTGTLSQYGVDVGRTNGGR